MKSQLTFIIFTLILLIGSHTTSYGQVTVSRDRDLSFGAIMVQTAGSVTIAADATSTTTPSSGIVLLDYDERSSAAFAVRVTRNIWGTSISTPSTINLNGPNSNVIQIKNITNSGLGGFLGYLSAGNYMLYVGGTINVNPTMPGGLYSGTFTITVNNW